MLDSRVETLSIATVPECHRSSATTPRATPDGSANQVCSPVFMQQSCSLQADDYLLSCPAMVHRDNNLQCEDQNDTGQSSVAMQVSFLIHLQDPVELLPHAVDIDSD